MEYLDFVVLIVPAVIGLVASFIFGPNRGIIAGVVVTLVAVLVLLAIQVTPHEVGSAMGLMRFEWYRWVPAFLVGVALAPSFFGYERAEGEAEQAEGVREQHASEDTPRSGAVGARAGDAGACVFGATGRKFIQKGPAEAGFSLIFSKDGAEGACGHASPILL